MSSPSLNPAKYWAKPKERVGQNSTPPDRAPVRLADREDSNDFGVSYCRYCSVIATVATIEQNGGSVTQHRRPTSTICDVLDQLHGYLSELLLHGGQSGVDAANHLLEIICFSYH